MLARLQVRNYVLIDSLEVDFPEGLIIITGQTGAGKSILLGALSLLMGAKADSSVLSPGADNCVVEAEFVFSSERLNEILRENDIDQDEGGLIVRRVVNRSGRSRSFVNDCPVSVHVLQELSSVLIDIHSQHQTLMLSDRKYQLELLDFFAGNSELRQECRLLWQKKQALSSELADLDGRIAAIEKERDYNETQFRQLESASLRVGELAELEEEQKQLANAEEIKTCLGAVQQLFNPSEDVLSLDAALKESVRQLNRVSRYISSASELAERLDSSRRELDDIITEITDINDRTDLSQERLEEVESRMSLLYGLFQKHSCTTEEELIALRDKLSDELFDSSRMEEKRKEILDQLAEVSSAISSVADALSASRVEAASAFALEICNSIRNLELPYAVFEVAVDETALSATGHDVVSFRFSSTGSNPVDVARCASGGEMSRIMLALKNMRARFASMPTMIFDEIDTGVSGSVADKIGSMICDMGDNMQVFAITHLPQVAAKGQAHYLVSKDVDPAASKAVTTIKRLSDDQRVLEVARMLSGSSLTDAAVANAKSLLSI